MAVKLERIGHCALRVRDVERSKQFYTEVLGFQLMEQDPVHGGVFMSLPNDGHTIDISSVSGSEAVPSPARGRHALGVRHLAFKTGSYEALREAYDTLLAHDVSVERMIDHVSQRSLYFADPDGNQLEIYYEYTNARDLFMQGRGDRDTPFTWQDPLPPWAVGQA